MDPRLSKALSLVSRVIESDVAHGFPSACLAVRHKGEKIFSSSFGDAVRDTLYDLASNTKVYAATYAAQRLATQGLLDPDAPVIDILGPRFADDTTPYAYAGTDPIPLSVSKEWKRRITVRDIMCHQAGFPSTIHLPRRDLGPDGALPGDLNPFYAGADASLATRERVRDILMRVPLKYLPRTDAVYSDVDFLLLTQVIEAIAGERLDDYLQREIYGPLGLSRTTFCPLAHGFSPSDCAPTELHGNTRDGAVYFDGVRTGEVRGQVHDENAYYAMAGISGHAGLFSTADELARLASLMLPSSPDHGRFFSPAVMRDFTRQISPARTGAGTGWWRQGEARRTRCFGPYCSPDTTGHTGWTGTLTMIEPEEDLVIVLLTNKIHTPVTDPSRDRNGFDGNRFTTATLGFAPRLIMAALKDLPLEKELACLVSERETSLADSPSPAAERALEAIRSVASETTI